jgi:hypothetical protein
MKTRLSSLIESGAQQAKVYSDHLRANLGWSDHEVSVIVVFDGPVRYVSRRAELIYLGEAAVSDSVSID